MKAIIIVNEGGGKPKALLRIYGLTLLERSLYTLKKTGINDFLIVCSSERNAIDKYITNQKLSEKFKLTLCGEIDDIHLQGGKFLILGDDTIFDENIIKDLVIEEAEGPIICVDSSPKYVKMDKGSSKEFLNAGILLCDRKSITALKGSIQEPLVSKEFIIKAGIEIHDVNGAFWYRINTQKDIRIAEDALLNKNLSHEDTEVITKCVRKFPAKFLARNLAKTSITPNQVSLLTLLSFLAAALLFSFGRYTYDIIAGTLVLLAFTFDNTDGVVARLKLQTSRFGQWFDNITYIIGFNAMIFGAGIGLYFKTQSILPLTIGVVLLFLNLVILYDAKLAKEHLVNNSSPTANLSITLPTFREGTTFRRLLDFYAEKRAFYFGGGAVVSLILIGALLNRMLIVFLILLATAGIPWLAGLAIRWKDKDAIG